MMYSKTINGESWRMKTLENCVDPVLTYCAAVRLTFVFLCENWDIGNSSAENVRWFMRLFVFELEARTELDRRAAKQTGKTCTATH